MRNQNGEEESVSQPNENDGIHSSSNYEDQQDENSELMEGGTSDKQKVKIPLNSRSQSEDEEEEENPEEEDDIDGLR